MTWRPVLGILGRLLLLLALLQLLPFAVCLLYGEAQAARGFLISAAAAAVAGMGGARYRHETSDLFRREGILVVVGGWVLASLFGALPYLFAGVLTHPVDALFESASGFTTTGATVLTAIESSGRGLLFWRSLTQWLGGMGIIVLFVALLPELGAGARFLYRMEVPGPTKEAFAPRIRDSAGLLWKIYLGLTGVLILLLLLCGLDIYDAVTHAFSTVSSGGFSPYTASVGIFENPAVEVVILLFMFLAGVNFSLYYALRGRGWRDLLRNEELRIYAAILLAATVVVGFDLLRHDTFAHPGRAVFAALFHVVSVTTTTGFLTADYETWPQLSRMVLVALMFVGGCAGSTSGSMKVMRMVIGVKAAWREVRQMSSPNQVQRVFADGKAVPEDVVRSVAGFFILYLTCWGIGTVLLAATDLDLVSAATAAAASIGNVGPGLDAVGPLDDFAFLPAWDKLVLVALMWLGRLELYAIAALLSRRFWRG